MEKQTWWLLLCTCQAGPVSPAHSSPPQPPEWQGPALGCLASADLSADPNAGLWNGAELASHPAERSEACHLLGATLKPGTWHGELTGWIRQPGNGRRKNLEPENTACYPQGRDYAHTALKERITRVSGITMRKLFRYDTRIVWT